MDSSRAALRLFVFSLAILMAARLALGQPAEQYLLKAEHATDDLAKVEVTLQVGGDVKLATEGRQRMMPMCVVATIRYDERTLESGESRGLVRSARLYDEASAVIKVDKGGEKPQLPEEKRLIVVDLPAKGPPTLYAPNAPLTRQELDLIDVPGNTLAFDRLLPSEPVKVGDSWKLDDATLAVLLGLEAVSVTDVKCTLGSVTDEVADIGATGSIAGAVGGVATEIEIKARYKFDLAQKRITQLAMLIKEKRAIGHIGPGLDTVAKLVVKISPISGTESLDSRLADIPAGRAGLAASQLTYESPAGFGFDYDRRWFLTTEDPKLAVFRLLDRGELIAQCNVSAITGGKAKRATLAEFQKDVQASLGKNFGQFTAASQYTSSAGYSVMKVSVRGVVSKLPIEWIYYLVCNDKGHRVSLAFTLEESLSERFAHADRELVNGIHLSESAALTATRPSTAK